jgi:putative cardiolipin synthase
VEIVCMTRIALLLVVAAVAAFGAGCTGLPPLDGRAASTALADTAQTKLGRALAPALATHSGKTGIKAALEPRDAFAARVLLAAAAEKSIDAQYYIWHGDEVGYLLFEALWQAAKGGVRVRLLLDDMNTGGLDPTIAALDAHPNIEVRLYNPVVLRGARAINFLTDFSRVNRRMHNKSFTVDNRVSVVGGRNIGNEYFGAGSGVVFADLDVVAVGTAVGEVSREFDTYWNSPSAHPAASFVGTGGLAGATDLEARFAATRADPDSVAYIEALKAAPIVPDILERKIGFEWTKSRLVYDDPAKTLEPSAAGDLLLFPELVRLMGQPVTSLDLVSPYFVPGGEGTAALVALASRGVQVRILTNSLASSDVAAVHAGYAKRRVDLLRSGLKLYELKPTAVKEGYPTSGGFGSSSSSGLHAKTFAVDRTRIFVGSFNFDQRSALLNTEMGLVIDSPTLAQELAERFEDEIPRVSYEVRLAADGRNLEWIERTAAGEKRYDVEPDTSVLRRFSVEMMSILPIEWLL